MERKLAQGKCEFNPLNTETMVKEKEAKPRKNIKKEPAQSLKEKRAAKEAKKAGKSRM